MKANSPRIKFLRTITKCIKERKCCRPFAYAHHKLLLWRDVLVAVAVLCSEDGAAAASSLRLFQLSYFVKCRKAPTPKAELPRYDIRVQKKKEKEYFLSACSPWVYIGRKKLRGRNFFLIFYSFELELCRKCTNVKNCWKSWIALGDIASWNVLMFLKLVAKWREIQKSKLNNSLINWAFQKNFFTLLFLSRLSRSFKIIYLFWHILKFMFCSQSCDVIFKPKNVKIEKQKT